MIRLMSTLVLIVACMASSGCGTGADKSKAARPKTVPAKGVVSYKGQPVAQALIVLEPTATGGVAASAQSDDKGHFDLLAFPPDPGAVPGSYKVTITKIEVAPSVMVTEASHDEPAPKPTKPKHLIPEKYSNSRTSGLIATIPDGGIETLNFELEN